MNAPTSARENPSLTESDGTVVGNGNGYFSTVNFISLTVSAEGGRPALFPTPSFFSGIFLFFIFLLLSTSFIAADARSIFLFLHGGQSR